MSLINEKNYDLYDYKPSEIDEIISIKHQEYENSIKIIQSKCPACKSSKYNFAFDKYSFHYVQCQECMSMYIQNRLEENEVKEYEEYLKKELYNTLQYNKYLNLLSEKISFEMELTFSRLFNKKQFLNIAYLGNKNKVYENVFKEFSTDFNVVESIKQLKNQKYDLIILDHFIERSNNVEMIMYDINNKLKDNGIVYLAMRVGSGIDILTLWDDSKVYPLEHNNLFSINGIKILLEKNNFNIKELNTPGVLDIDNILKTQSKHIPKFLMYLNSLNNKKVLEEFQAFIQKNLLSSFTTIIAERK